MKTAPAALNATARIFPLGGKAPSARFLIVHPCLATGLERARQLVDESAEAVVTTTAAAALALAGPFDRALVSYELVDGSGVVLTADLLLAGNVAAVEFLPADPVEDFAWDGDRSHESLHRHVA